MRVAALPKAPLAYWMMFLNFFRRSLKKSRSFKQPEPAQHRNLLGYRVLVPVVGAAEPVLARGTGSLQTRRWRKPDSNLYGAFPVKWCFWFVAVLCSEVCPAKASMFSR